MLSCSSPDYIPPSLRYDVHPTLPDFLAELEGKLESIAASRVGYILNPQARGTADVRDLLVLELVNRARPQILHLREQGTIHPERLYQLLVGLAGEMATYAAGDRRPPPFAVYHHPEPGTAFQPLIKTIRQLLVGLAKIEGKAVPVPLHVHKSGIRTTEDTTPELFKESSFVLAVRAAVPTEQVRNRFPRLSVIGPAEEFQDLFTSRLRGIGLEALPVAPRQIPFHSGMTYFELDRSNAYWQRLPALQQPRHRRRGRLARARDRMLGDPGLSHGWGRSVRAAVPGRPDDGGPAPARGSPPAADRSAPSDRIPRRPCAARLRDPEHRQPQSAARGRHSYTQPGTAPAQPQPAGRPGCAAPPALGRARPLSDGRAGGRRRPRKAEQAALGARRPARRRGAQHAVGRSLGMGPHRARGVPVVPDAMLASTSSKRWQTCSASPAATPTCWRSSIAASPWASRAAIASAVTEAGMWTAFASRSPARWRSLSVQRSPHCRLIGRG